MTNNRFGRAIAVAAAVSLVVVGVAGCGNDDAPVAEGPTIAVELGRYTIAPAELVVPAGAVTLQVTNVDNMAHNLVVAGYGTRTLAPGATQSLPIDTDPGEYNMFCDVPGHAAMGQTGTMRSEAPVVTATSS